MTLHAAKVWSFLLEHNAGYRLAGGEVSNLTANQEIFVALVAIEQIKLSAKMAGAEVKERPRKQEKGKDAYGEMLERRARMADMAKQIQADPESLAKYSKPL